MSTNEIIALISIILSIIYVWGRSQNEVAKLQVQILSLTERLNTTDTNLKEFITTHIGLESASNIKVMEKLDELKNEINGLKVEMAANGFAQAPKRN